MVSTRHHPRPFPEPTLSPSQTRGSEKSVPPTPTPSTASKTKSSARRKTLTKSEDSSDQENAKDTNDTVALVAKTPTRTKSTTRRKSTKSSSPSGSYTHRPPNALLIWLFISIPLVIWDCGYVLLRPHTFPGGKLAWPIWAPYAMYGTVDYTYGWPAWEKRIGFCAAQGWLNVLESILYLRYLSFLGKAVQGGWKDGVFQKLYQEGNRARIVLKGDGVCEAVLALFTATVMTFSKTVLYFLYEAFSDFANIGHNNLGNMVMWLVLNGAWIVIPFCMIIVLVPEILAGMNGTQEVKDD